MSLWDKDIPGDPLGPGRFPDAFDLAFLLLITAGLLAIILDTPTLPVHPGWDMNYYIAIAQDPGVIFQKTMPAIAAQRPVPSVLVWALHHGLGLTLAQGFKLISGAAYLGAHLMMYAVLRAWPVRPETAFATSALAAIFFWPMTYSLHNVYQGCDAFTYPLSLLMIMLTLKHRALAVFLVGLVAILTRQNLVVLLGFSLVHLWWTRRESRILLYLVAAAAWFILSGLLLGKPERSFLELFHPANFGLDQLWRGISDTQVILRFAPFLLVLIRKRTVELALRYWWITGFALITILQPLVNYELAGRDNALRIMTPGIWICFLAAGIIMAEQLRTWWLRAIYVLCPFLYGLAETYMAHRYPCLLGGAANLRMTVLIFGLAVIGQFLRPWWQRRRRGSIRG